MDTRNDLIALGSMLPFLKGRDYEFAASLCLQAQSRKLSDKQMHWVKVLADRAIAASQPQAPAPVAPVASNEAAADGCLWAIPQMLYKAAASLKFPAVELAYEECGIRLAIAGPNSRYAGLVTVTSVAKDSSKNPGQRRWFGTIDHEGRFQPPMSLSPNAVQGISRALLAFAKDPNEAARSTYQKTGACVFCRRTLTDERSLATGYGPVCADNFGLPWGEAKAPGVMVCEGI